MVCFWYSKKKCFLLRRLPNVDIMFEEEAEEGEKRRRRLSIVPYLFASG
jgi:hypothetical protein